MYRKNLLLTISAPVLLLVATTISVPAHALENKEGGSAKRISVSSVSGEVPYTRALQALKDNDLTQFDRWLGITTKDFGDQAVGIQSMVLRMSYYLGRELSHLAMAKHLSMGSKEVGSKEVGSKEVTSRKKRWELLAKEYRIAAREQWGQELYQVADKFIERDKNLPIKLKVQLPLDQEKGLKLRGELQQGAFLNANEREILERHEWTNQFVGFVALLLNVESDRLAAMDYTGTVNRARLYHGVGARLKILGEDSGNLDYLRLAKRYFNRVMELTVDEPYGHERQLSQDFLKKLNALSLDSPKQVEPQKVQEKKTEDRRSTTNQTSKASS